MNVQPLERVNDAELFGGKAVALGRALRAGLPVPPGHGLSVALVDALVEGDAGRELDALGELAPEPRYAVRSSAVDEDSSAASFAGQHLTRLAVRPQAIVAAVREVWASGRTEAARCYRARLCLGGEARIAVVVQRMVAADCAGVMFTRDPRTGADHRVIEAAWGLGEAVVTGLVTPDRVVMDRGGRVREYSVGNKDLTIVAAETGGTHELALPSDRAAVACLNDAQLEMLEQLARACEASFHGPSDIEWAFESDALFLLQRRAVTR